MSRSAVLCSMPATGHVGPLSVVAGELVRRGWRVRMLTGAGYEAPVRASGAEFVALPAEADTLDSIGAGERTRGLATINHGVEQAFVAPAAPAGQALEQMLADEPADVVLHDMTFLGVQTLFSRPRDQRPATVLCGIGPAGFSSVDTAPYGLGLVPWRRTVPNRLRNRLLYRTSRVVLRPVHRSLDRFLAEFARDHRQAARREAGDIAGVGVRPSTARWSRRQPRSPTSRHPLGSTTSTRTSRSCT